MDSGSESPGGVGGRRRSRCIHPLGGRKNDNGRWRLAGARSERGYQEKIQGTFERCKASSVREGMQGSQLAACS